MKRMIILAAGMGQRLRPLTDDRPKCLVPLRGRAMLEWQIAAARRAGVENFTLVGGYRADRLSALGHEVIENTDYERSNMVESLWRARRVLAEGALISYGDIVCDERVIRAALECRDDIGVAVDLRWRSYWERRFADPLKDAESLRMDADGRLLSVGQKTKTIEEIQAQFLGLIFFSAAGGKTALDWYQERCAQSEGARSLFMTDLLQGLINFGAAVQGIPVEGGWLEVDSPEDLRLAESLTRVEDGVLKITR